MEKRLQAQTDQKHWIGRMNTERQKVEEAQNKVELVQKEFEVRSASILPRHVIDGVALV